MGGGNETRSKYVPWELGNECFLPPLRCEIQAAGCAQPLQELQSAACKDFRSGRCRSLSTGQAGLYPCGRHYKGQGYSLCWSWRVPGDPCNNQGPGWLPAQSLPLFPSPAFLSHSSFCLPAPLAAPAPCSSFSHFP